MLPDEDRTKEQLMSELAMLRQRVAELEALEGKRKQAEFPLPGSDEYQRLFELSPVGITILDMKGVITACNSAVYMKSGYSKDDFIGQHFSKVSTIRARDIPKFIKIFASLIRGKVPKPLEVMYTRKDGTTGWTEAHISLMKLSGKRIGIQVIQNDITERKQAEEEIVKLAKFPSENPNPVLRVAKDGTILYANEASLPLLNVWGTQMGRLLPDYWRKFILDVLGSGSSKNNEVEYGNRVLSLTFSPVVDAGYVNLYGLDITERKQAEEREKELQRELSLSRRLAAVGELAAGVAHEINNPLTGVLGFSGRLLRRSTDEEIRRDLERIHSEAQRMVKVMDNLRAFTRRCEPEKQYSDINDILHEILELRAYELRTGNIEVVTDFTPGLSEIEVDSHQIQEVFLNIILNAEQIITEAHTGGKLTIKTGKIKDYVRISFTDDGPGISAKHLDKLFDPFFTTRGEKGGTGLGLSICRGIVIEHGGKIYAKSRLGKGTTFFVELPVATEGIDEGK